MALTGRGRPPHPPVMTTDEPQEPVSIEQPETEVADLAEELDEVDGHDVLAGGDSKSPSPAPSLSKLGNALVMRNLWITIGGLTFLLIVSMLVNLTQKKSRGAVNGPDLAALQVELEVRRGELNRQRAELNLPPLAGRGEDVDAIRTRLRKDTDTLVSLVDRYQKLIAEKDGMLAEKNLDLIRSEQVRESLTDQLARVQTHSAGSAQMQVEAVESRARAERLGTELVEVQARATRLADELAEARAVIAEFFDKPAAGDTDVLQRQLEEALRARDFYKQRAEQIEAPSGDEGTGEDEE